MDLLNETQMGDLSPTVQAQKAIAHTLQQIRENGVVGYQLGIGTQTFALLTEAAASLWKLPVHEVREKFMPKNPVSSEGKTAEILLLRWEHRIDDLENRVTRTDAHENQALGIQACVDDLREATGRK